MEFSIEKGKGGREKQDIEEAGVSGTSSPMLSQVGDIAACIGHTAYWISPVHRS